MRTIWTVAYYDLLRSAKQRETFFMGLLMPGLMMILLGIAMGGDDTSIVIDVIDEDRSPLSQQLVTLLQDEVAGEDAAFVICPFDAAEVDDACDLDADLSAEPDRWRATGDERLEDTEAYGTLIIEPGFGVSLRGGETVTVYFKNSDALSAPTLASQKIDAAISRMGGSVAITNLALNVAEEHYGPLADHDLDRTAAFDRVRAEVEQTWAARPVEVREEGTAERPATLGFNQSGPGIAVMFVLIFMLNAATVLISERETGTLQRLYSLPVRRAQILAGKVLGQYLYGLGIFGMLVIVGALMGVEWGDNLAGLLLVMLVYTLACTALGVALSTVVRTSDQASSISMLMGLTLAPLGGAWWPLEIVPDFMQTVGHISPIAWAMDAFNELMFYEGTVTAILPMLGVLLLMTAAFFVFGVVNFKYE